MSKERSDAAKRPLDRRVMPTLGKELWKQIEGPQGFAYISDVIETMTDAEVLSIAHTALPQAEKAVEVLREFLARHNAGVTGLAPRKDNK